MMLRTFSAARAAACVLAGALLSGAAAAAPAVPPATPPQGGQTQPKDQKQQVPEAELKAAQAIETNPDAAAALAAAAEFAKKYPKSKIRTQVLAVVLSKIEKAPAAAQRITLAEGFQKTFAAPDESALVSPMLVQAYVEAQRLDDAFRLATPAALEKFNDPVGAMINLTVLGADELRKKNGKFATQSQQMGLKAVELLEADRKPERVTAERWAEYKTRWLPQLHHSLGLIAFASQNAAEAKTRFERASALGSTDPMTYVFIGELANDRYKQLRTQYDAAAGAAKDQLLKDAFAQMDVVIDSWARVVALAEGDARYDQLRTQITQDLESYYKFRNKGSVEGLRALIDKHKKPAPTTP